MYFYQSCHINTSVLWNFLLIKININSTEQKHYKTVCLETKQHKWACNLSALMLHLMTFLWRTNNRVRYRTALAGAWTVHVPRGRGFRGRLGVGRTRCSPTHVYRTLCHYHVLFTCYTVVHCHMTPKVWGVHS